MPLDYFESLSLSSLLLICPLGRRFWKVLRSKSWRRAWKCSRRWWRCGKRTKNLRNLLLQEQVSLGLVESDLWGMPLIILVGFFEVYKAKRLSQPAVGIKRYVYLEGWIWVPFISQILFPRMFIYIGSFLQRAVLLLCWSHTHLLRPFSMRPFLISSSINNSSLLFLLILFLCFRKRRD